MNSISEIFWSETFWFPEGYTWKDLENVNGSQIYLPQNGDILWSIPLGILLLGIRYLFEMYLMTPLGYWLGVKKKQKAGPVSPNPVLEKYYEKNGITSNNNLESVAKQTDMSVREVERWLRNRKAQTLTSDITKFRECGWHFTFYLGIFVYGLVVLWNKIWFWETINCWKGWPKLNVQREIYWYYLVELSFYWCLVFSMMTEHKRKDFLQMIIHHIATILLIYFSWVSNFVRVGTLVLIAHDAADFPMAAAKMMKYSGHKKACEILLGVFIVVWILSRLIYYPFVSIVKQVLATYINHSRHLIPDGIHRHEGMREEKPDSPFMLSVKQEKSCALYSAVFEVRQVIAQWQAHNIFIGLLVTLQILHFIWTYMICRIAYRSIFHKKLGDVRSDSESDSD